ncbi:ABC transporter permease [Streptomyces sp. NRRL S-87]|uniref:ABC transporter permease n=1 Tax=Streptomyces sp. NRRL S-87 TaxID=1463920 RepID=UPI00068F12B5|nr:ABC transporter permease [Streptomyces sp. NRRL S-87]
MGTALLLPVAVATLRKRWLGFVGSFVALALGVALISATGLLVSTSAGLENADPSAPSLKKLLTFMAGMSGFVSVFVVASTFAFAVAGRRRETALLRAVGATPRQVRVLVLGEAAVVSLAASGCGALLGLAAAQPFADWLVARGAAPEGFTVELGPGPLLVAAGVEVAVAVVGAYAAARRAGRVRPVEALADAAVDRRVMTAGRWVWAVGYLVVFGAVLALFTTMPPGTDDPQLRDPQNLPVWSLLIDVMAIMAVALFAPLLVPPLVRLLTLPVPLATGAVGLLARQNALASVRRTVSTATPMFLVIGLTGTVVGSTLTFGDARTVQSREALGARYVVEPAAGSALPPGTVERLRALPGTGTTTVRTTWLDGLGGGADASSATAGTIAATAVDGDAAATWRLPAREGSLTALRGATTAVSASLAEANGWRVGDRLSTVLADGTPVDLRVVAVVDTPLSLAEVLLPYSVVAGHLTDDAGPSAAFLTAPRAVPAPAADPGVKVTPAHAWGGDGDARSRSDRIAMVAVLGPALLYALIAIVNTMMMSTGDRLRDFSTLRLTGGNDRQVLSMVGVEALLTAATATVLALLVTTGTQAATLMLVGHRILRSGPELPLSLPWSAIATAAAAGLGLALVSSLVPARLALRARALDLASARQ